MHLKVRKRYGQRGWVLKLWQDGRERYVPRDRFPNSINSEMTMEQARKRVKAINAASRPPAQGARLRAANRHRYRMRIMHTWLPAGVVLEYEKTNILFLKEDDATRRQRELIWAAAQRLICALDAPPSEWASSVDDIYAYLAGKKYSWDYCMRILSAVNRYGELYSRYMQTRYYPLELRDRKKRAAIEASFGGGRESEPLDVDALRALENRIPQEKYNWLWIAFWFGLRPQEVDMLKAKVWRDGMPAWWLEEDERTLVVYQPKLQIVKAKKRYRRIPLKFPEQVNALERIKAGYFERPSIKEASRWLTNQVSLYGCRHGFACHMDRCGIDVYAISRWLGHQSVKTTERYYVRLGMKRDAMIMVSERPRVPSSAAELLKSLLMGLLRLVAAHLFRHPAPLGLPFRSGPP